LSDGARERPLRVALDWTPLLDPPTGVGRYTAQLGAALESHGVELTRYAIARGAGRSEAPARWRVPTKVVQAAWRRFGRPSIERLVGAVDVVHAPNFVLPVSGSIPGVVTVHDLSFLSDEAFPGGHRLRDLVPWSLRRAARVLVPTQAVKDEILDYAPVAHDRVVVTHEGVSQVFYGATPLPGTVLAEMGIRPPFALAVGTIEPRKNLPRLLEAWRQARADGALAEWMLVIAGPQGWGPSLPETPGVALVGWVGDETLPGLLAAAELFCYPSLYEGFGLPPLEAMAAGVPALVGRYAAAAETLGDAAEVVDPRDVDALAGALARLASDDELRRSYARAGKARAASFTWERTAAATLSAYRATLEDG
jgi:glycosyltransferase involved in cell wall biosynthesis